MALPLAVSEANQAGVLLRSHVFFCEDILPPRDSTDHTPPLSPVATHNETCLR